MSSDDLSPEPWMHDLAKRAEMYASHRKMVDGDLYAASTGRTAMGDRQQEIAAWADATFGEAPSKARIAARANEEMAELLRHATADADQAAMLEEAADVVIILFRLARECGGDLMAAVDAKMERNRRRVWKLDGTGHGYHVREDSHG